MTEQELCPSGFHLISTCEFAGKPVQDSDGKYVIRNGKFIVPEEVLYIFGNEDESVIKTVKFTTTNYKE